MRLFLVSRCSVAAVRVVTCIVVPISCCIVMKPLEILILLWCTVRVAHSAPILSLGSVGLFLRRAGLPLVEPSDHVFELLKRCI